MTSDPGRAPHLTLFSRDLLSKWGFNDGADPDDWLDYCEAGGIDYNAVDFPLVELVRRYLLPQIDQRITIVEVETCHNPIRAETVDGVNVTEVWFGRAPEPVLTPEYVEIPMAEVVRVAEGRHHPASERPDAYVYDPDLPPITVLQEEDIDVDPNDVTVLASRQPDATLPYVDRSGYRKEWKP